jgi:hypothetical protein
MISEKIKKYNELAEELDKIHNEICDMSEKFLKEKINGENSGLTGFDFRHCDFDEDCVTWWGYKEDLSEWVDVELKVEEME